MARKVKLVVAVVATLFAFGSVAAPAEAKHADKLIIGCC